MIPGVPIVPLFPGLTDAQREDIENLKEGARQMRGSTDLGADYLETEIPQEIRDVYENFVDYVDEEGFGWSYRFVSAHQRNDQTMIVVASKYHGQGYFELKVLMPDKKTKTRIQVFPDLPDIYLERKERIDPFVDWFRSIAIEYLPWLYKSPEDGVYKVVDRVTFDWQGSPVHKGTFVNELRNLSRVVSVVDNVCVLDKTRYDKYGRFFQFQWKSMTLRISSTQDMAYFEDTPYMYSFSGGPMFCREDGQCVFTHIVRSEHFPERKLASWFEACVVNFSPWIFRKHEDENMFTVVDRVTLCFEEDVLMDRDTFKDELRGLPNVSVCHDVCVMNRERYKPWEELFQFQWESLTLRITKDVAYFEEPITGRKSKYIFHLPGGPEYSPDGECIPWLYCQA